MKLPNLRVVKNEAEKSADIFLYGIIGDYWYNDNPLTARGFLRQLSLLSDYSIIHVHLNGPGGDIHEGLAICNAIKASKKEIHTWNDGLCASMFAVILASADEGRRHGAKGSLVMAHDASTVCWGNASEMRETADMLDAHNSVLSEFLADATGLTVDQVMAKWMDGKDHWMTAKQAADENLLIIEDYEAQPLPENVQEQPMDKIAAFFGGKFTEITHTQLKNENMALINFGNNLKKTTALGKKPVADRTEADFVEANKELEEEGLTGMTLVSDTDLQETVAAAQKVPGLEKTIKELQQKVKDQEEELGKPAEEITNPVTDKDDKNDAGKGEVKNEFETSFDRELKSSLGVN